MENLDHKSTTGASPVPEKTDVDLKILNDSIQKLTSKIDHLVASADRWMKKQKASTERRINELRMLNETQSKQLEASYKLPKIRKLKSRTEKLKILGLCLVIYTALFLPGITIGGLFGYIFISPLNCTRT